MGDDYPNLDELVRQMPSEGSAIVSIQETVIMPYLWNKLRGCHDRAGEFVSGTEVRRIAFTMAVEWMRYYLSTESLVLPDVAALAGAPRAETPGNPPGNSSRPAADAVESAPCLPPN